MKDASLSAQGNPVPEESIKKMLGRAMQNVCILYLKQ